MAFIVEQQAQFAVDVQQMRELQMQTENVVERLAHATLVGLKDFNTKIDSLVDSLVEVNLFKSEREKPSLVQVTLVILARGITVKRNLALD